MMSALRDRLRIFLDQRLHSLAARPEIWGSAESVELQALQLLHVRAVVSAPDAMEPDARDPGGMRERYVAFLRTHFPGAPPVPLAEHLSGEPSLERFSQLLKAFIQDELARQDEWLDGSASGAAAHHEQDAPVSH